MACFEFLISFKNTVINTLASLSIKRVSVSKYVAYGDDIATEPTLNIGYTNPLIIVTRVDSLEVNAIKVGTFSVKTDIIRTTPDINIAIVCDINYGVPLYAQDGSIYTIDGKPVYVRTAKVMNYEGE